MTKLRSTLPALPMPFSPWFKVTKLCKSLDDWVKNLTLESTSLTVFGTLPTFQDHSWYKKNTRSPLFRKHLRLPNVVHSLRRSPLHREAMTFKINLLTWRGTNPTWFSIYPDTTNVTTDTTTIFDNSFEQQFYNFRQQWTRTTNNNHHSNKKKKNSNNRSKKKKKKKKKKNSSSKSSNQKSRPTSNFSSVDSQFLRLVPAVPRGCHHPRQLEGRCPAEISATILNHKFCYE